MKRIHTTGLYAACALVFALTQTAFGQAGAEVSAERAPFAVELKPLPTAMSFEQGVGAVGASAEAFFADKWAWFIGGAYTDMNLPNNLIQKGQNNNKNTPIPSDVIGYTYYTGARYYTDPLLGSWYGDLGAGYAEQTGKWNYKGTLVDSRAVSVLPMVGAGYRWVFANRVLVRLGANVAYNNSKVDKATATEVTNNYQDAENKVYDTLKTPVLASLDLGLGYAF